MKNAVTGATGHIGYALIKELKSRGEYVVAVAMENEDTSRIEEYADEIKRADVRDIQSLEKAFSGCDVVYHLAGIISIGKENQDIIYDVNVNGVSNAVEASKKMGVKTFIYTSSVHAIYPKKKGDKLTEQREYPTKKLYGNYAKTKAMGANIVLKANSDNFKTIVVLPSGVVGPYAFRRSNIGQLILDVNSGKLRVKIKGEYAFVDVRDVAFCMAELEKKGVGGESYIVSGGTITVTDMLNVMSDKYKKTRINNFFPVSLAKFFAPLCELYYRVRKVKPLFTAESLYTLSHNCQFDTSKIEKTVGIKFRDIKKSIEDEIEFYKTQKIT